MFFYLENALGYADCVNQRVNRVNHRKRICCKLKVLSDNELPLMLRVTKDRKRKYVSLGISVNPEHWDFSKNQPKAECPNHEYIELLIADKLKEYSV